MAGTNHRFSLSFALIECRTCNAQRIRGVRCPDCGESPAHWEVDQRTAARSRAVQAAQRALNDPAHPAPASPFALDEAQQLLLRLEGWLPSFFDALRAVSKGSEDSAELLRRAVTAILNEGARATAVPRRRPWIPVIDGLVVCIQQMKDMVRSYLCAMAAETPLAAQERAAEAQVHLDAAGRTLLELSETLEAATRLLGAATAKEQLQVLLYQAIQRHGANDIMQLDNAAGGVLGRLTGTEPAPGHGAGLQFAVQDTGVRAWGDVIRFRRIVADSFRVFGADPGLLAALAAAPDFLPDVQASLLDLFDSSTQAFQAVQTSTITRQVGRALLDLTASQVEGTGRVIATALLVAAGHKSRPYDKLRQDNATDLIRNARGHDALAPLLDGFDVNLRTAQAHRMARIDDEGVAYETRNGAGHQGWAELADGILTACESSMGCLVGMLHALALLDVGFGDTNDYQALGISPAEMTAAWLTLQGCEDVVISERDDSWEISLAATPSQQLTDLLTAPAVLMPDTVESLTLRAMREQTLHVLSGPTSCLKPFAQGDVNGDGHGMTSIRMQRFWTHNGVPCIDEAVMRKWFADQVTRAEREAPSNPIPRLRALRSLALELGDAQLAAVLTAAMRCARLGEEVDRQTVECLSLLPVWGVAPVTYAPV
ncbi:hypothetical protein ACIRBY_00760 [Streptomyces sp. NPDC096136]|uniref:hypothetical protein n=1 Tax=Streptomyces sp. NPDC096136 TaxID=3366076 RepID=UPI0038041AD5